MNTYSWGVCIQWIVSHRPELYLVVISYDIGVQLTVFNRVLSQL